MTAAEETIEVLQKQVSEFESRVKELGEENHDPSICAILAMGVVLISRHG